MSNRIKNLEGKRFGKLVAVSVAQRGSAGKGILWNCVCDCGKKVERLCGALIKGEKLGTVQSCGCASEYDLTGKTFGKLTALKKVRKEKDRGVIWSFQCSCGSIVEKVGSQVRRGQGAQHCGCVKRRGGNNKNDLTGKQFGRLTVVRFAGTNSRQQSLWECSCSCGKTVTIRGYHLRRGKEDCGCVPRRVRKKNGNWKGVGDIPGSYFTRLRKGAEIRNLDFSVTLEYLWKKFLQQKRKCALSGVLLRFATYGEVCMGVPFTASLDRRDNTKGYVKRNVQWVHKKVNQIKTDMSTEEFLEWCERITHYDSR